MAIGLDERYKQAFAAQQYAADFRVKIVTGWATFYAGFAAAFVWVQENHKRLSWLVTLIAAAITVLMWIADKRNRIAIHRSKDVGASIEKDAAAAIPDEQRFFAHLDEGISHSRAIDFFAVIVLIALMGATVYLFCTGGVFKS